MANLQLISNLSKYREYYGYTQEKLCEHLNISRQAYSNYERGKRDPDLDLLIKLCGIYNITLDQLVQQPFRKSNLMICEPKPPYTTAVDEKTEDTLYLSRKELSFLLDFREAEDETQYVIMQLLQKK